VTRRLLLALTLLLPAAAGAQTASAATELTSLLHAFLDGASRNDPAVHDRFWADDLIYTGSSGRRVGKADIMKDVRSEPTTATPATVYTAEDVRIQHYGDTALVAFRLVATSKTEPTMTFYNTGTFVKRAGEWRAVGWQATRIPASSPAPPTPSPRP
jgi:hypothetical protein